MRKFLIKSLLFIAFVLCIGLNKSIASHTAAMEIFYRHSVDSTYEFTVVFYRNCQGLTATAPANIWIQASAVSINRSPLAFNCLMLPISGPGVPPIHPKNMLNCTNPTLFCYEEYVYRGNWTSPQRATDWLFTYDLCCLPVTVAPANMQNGSMWIECGLNNLDFPDWKSRNRSPFWHNRRPNHPGYLMDTVHNPAFVSVCEGRTIHLNQSVRNYDQDEIKYEMFWPQTAGSLPNNYINGYTFSVPMSTLGSIGIDSLTGMMNFTAGAPTGTGIYWLGIKATEYRNDTVIVQSVPTIVKKEIGFVKRNLFIIVTPSASCPDQTFQFKDSASANTVSSISIKCDDNPFKIEFKQNVLCSSIDSNGTHVLLINAITQDTVNVVKSYSTDCSRDYLTKGFSVYLDSALQGGTYYLLFRKGDDGNTLLTDCSRELVPLADTLTINVTPAPPTGLLIADSTPGSPDTLELECHVQDFSVYLTESFRCNSVGSNGSDFHLVDLSTFPPKSKSISSANTTGACVQGFANKVNLKTTSVLQPGYYLLSLVTGTDGNSLLTYCRENFDTSSIVLKVKDVSLDLGPDITYCKNSGWDTTLIVSSWASYTWNTGSFANSITINVDGIYWLKVFTAAGCFTTDTVEVIEKDCFIGMDEKQERQSIHVYPNPVSHNLHVEIENFENGMSLGIKNRSGQVMFDKPLTSPVQQVNVTEYKPGLYLVEVSGIKGTIFRRKIVVK